MRSALAEDTLPNIVSPPPSRPISGPAPRPAARAVTRPTPIAPTPPRSVGPRTQVTRPQPAPVPRPTPAGAARPHAAVSGVHVKQPAPPRAARPMPTGGPAPTVIRDLDALFARDGRKHARPAPPRPVAPAQPPIEPARFAQMLLQKVEADFTPPRHNAVTAAPPPSAAPLAPAPTRVAASPYAAPFAGPFASPTPPPPARVAFVPTAVSAPAMLETLELALPSDDEDLAQLVPWYRRLWSKLFGR